MPCSQALPGVIRTNSYCGLESASEFAKCEVFVGCFEYSTSFYDWANCMEHSVREHGSLLLHEFWWVVTTPSFCLHLGWRTFASTLAGGLEIALNVPAAYDFDCGNTAF